jgi:predicted RNA-binding Zn-ribbon protein involved in translation (DUF1610 family)
MNEVFDTVRELKHSGPAPLACPRCGSLKVRQQGSLSGWLLPPTYCCSDCGYLGLLVLELEQKGEEKDEGNS